MSCLWPDRARVLTENYSELVRDLFEASSQSVKEGKNKSGFSHSTLPYKAKTEDEQSYKLSERWDISCEHAFNAKEGPLLVSKKRYNRPGLNGYVYRKGIHTE